MYYENSGVEWIGDIPKEWEIKRFKYINTGTNTGEQINKEWREDGETYLFSCSIEPERVSYHAFPIDKLTKERDLLLTRNARPYVFIPPVGSIYTDHVHRFSITQNVDIRLIYYALMDNSVLLYDEGVAIPTYTVSMWNNLYIQCPPLAEQKQIASYLDEKTTLIDDTINNMESFIENMEQYKQALIYEVVTGKRKV